MNTIKPAKESNEDSFRDTEQYEISLIKRRKDRKNEPYYKKRYGSFDSTDTSDSSDNDSGEYLVY